MVIEGTFLLIMAIAVGVAFAGSITKKKNQTKARMGVRQA